MKNVKELKSEVSNKMEAARNSKAWKIAKRTGLIVAGAGLGVGAGYLIFSGKGEAVVAAASTIAETAVDAGSTIVETTI